MLSKAERSVRLLRAVSWCRRLLLRSTIYAQSFSNSKVVFVRAIRRIRFFKTIALTVAALIACSAPAFSKTCESLASVNLQDVAIKSAVSISAGSRKCLCITIGDHKARPGIDRFWQSRSKCAAAIRYSGSIDGILIRIRLLTPGFPNGQLHA